MPKRADVERSRRELSLDVSVGVHILLVVEQSRLESQSRGCAKTRMFTVHHSSPVHDESCFINRSTLYPNRFYRCMS